MRAIGTLAMAVAVLGLCAASHAAWITIDDFNGYDNGQVDAVTTNWKGYSSSHVQIETDFTDPDNKVLRLQSQLGGQRQTAYGILSAEQQIANGTTATYFMRFRVSNPSTDMSFGLTDVAAPNDWGHFRVQLAAVNGNLSIRDGGSLRTVHSLNTGWNQAWYNLWMIVDNDSNTVKAYLHQDGLAHASEADLLTWTDPGTSQVRDTFAFRVGTTNALNRFFAHGQNNNDQRLWFDTMFVAPGTVLTNPVPEPASLGLLAVAGLLGLRRRRS